MEEDKSVNLNLKLEFLDMGQYIKEILVNVASVKLKTWAHQMALDRKLERQTTHWGKVFANHNLMQSFQTDTKRTLKAPEENMQHEFKNGQQV